jgi:ribosomal protein S18 acetylase RimI-like enzyme
VTDRDYRIVAADDSHGDAIVALMPRLAEFDLPASRNPRHLWEHDAEMFREWLRGENDCLVHAAVDDDGKVLGFTMVSLRPELLSHEPSAHLEAIALEPAAEGRGIAQALLAEAEASARARGALTMTLHVFAVNERARRLYERAGYDGELMRYIKPLGD